mgnify:CR=1 FL=1
MHKVPLIIILKAVNFYNLNHSQNQSQNQGLISAWQQVPTEPRENVEDQQFEFDFKKLVETNRKAQNNPRRGLGKIRRSQ